MNILKCTLADTSAIFNLYEEARTLQISKQMVVWPFFEMDFISKEINEERQWKITDGNNILCNWTITYEDKEIWEEKEQGDAIYIHRIVTNPDFRGNNYIKDIMFWAKEYAKKIGRKYVRLDTLGNNTKLIAHYTQGGFDFLGMVKLTNTETLPFHYQKEPNCCLFQTEISES